MRLSAAILQRLPGTVLDGLVPPRCLACLTLTATAQRLCGPCWSALSLIERPYCERLGTPFVYDHGPGVVSAEAIASPPPYERARAAALYAGPAVALVHRLKYADHTEVADLLGRLMARAGQELLENCDLIIPVPLYRWRLWWRRFNQSALLATVIATAARRPYAPLLLERHRATERQVGLSRNERARNVQGAFRVPDALRPELTGRRVLLVDDVLTSGATVAACTRALRKGGAAAVDVLTFARVAMPVTTPADTA